MATISKFYLLNAATPNTGTMPTNSPTVIFGFGTTGDATGASTARDATDVAGASNPDISASFASNADQNFQQWGMRRFVSRPLAAQTVPLGGSWTFSCAGSETSLNHNQNLQVNIYVWRPGSGAQVGTAKASVSLTEPGSTSVVALSNTGSASGTDQACLDGDILVLDIADIFTQGHSSSYTSTFEYDGTTEASITTCASFVTPPSALTLFTAAAATSDMANIANERHTARRRTMQRT